MKYVSDKGAPVWRKAVVLVLWVILLASLYAQLEIQIEGDQGWAAGLPTWRTPDNHVLNWFFGGRAVTGYHLFLFTFMAAVFHLPLAMGGRFTWWLEARILGSLMWFWLLEDLFWFALNPAFGLGRLTPAHATWHPHWLLGLPVDYIIFCILGGGLLGWSLYREYLIAHAESRLEARDSR